MRAIQFNQNNAITKYTAVEELPWHASVMSTIPFYSITAKAHSPPIAVFVSFILSIYSSSN